MTSYTELLAAFRTAVSYVPSGHLSHVIANAGCLGSRTWYPGESGYAASSISSDDPKEPGLPATQVGVIGTYYTVHLALHYLSRRSSQPASSTGTESTSLPTASDGSGEASTKNVVKGTDEDDRSILLTGSVASYRGLAHVADYCMAKAATRGLFRSLRADVREATGVRLNMLAPSFVDTPFFGGRVSKDALRFVPMEYVLEAAGRALSDPDVHGKKNFAVPLLQSPLLLRLWSFPPLSLHHPFSDLSSA